jgi:hypothetical protein
MRSSICCQLYGFSRKSNAPFFIARTDIGMSPARHEHDRDMVAARLRRSWTSNPPISGMHVGAGRPTPGSKNRDSVALPNANAVRPAGRPARTTMNVRPRLVVEDVHDRLHARPCWTCASDQPSYRVIHAAVARSPVELRSARYLRDRRRRSRGSPDGVHARRSVGRRSAGEPSQMILGQTISSPSTSPSAMTLPWVH